MWLVATPHSADMHSPASSGAPLRIVGEANLSSVSRVTHQGVGGLVALLPRALAFGALLATFEVLAGALSERVPLFRLHLLASHGASAAHSRLPPAWLCKAIGEVKNCSLI